MRLRKFKFKKVNSTNNTAIRIIKNSNIKLGMIIADSQLAGKGQYGKKWISYKGNVFVSFFYELKNIKASLHTLTKINCLLVKKTLEKYYKKKIVYKKPNDLLTELINKPINKINFENELKVNFVKNLSRMYKINNN